MKQYLCPKCMSDRCKKAKERTRHTMFCCALQLLKMAALPRVYQEHTCVCGADWIPEYENHN